MAGIKCRPIPSLTEDEIQFFNDLGQGKSSDECWEWGPCRFRRGYGTWYRRKVRKQICFMAHRVAYLAHYGVDPGQAFVCHSCDNPPCCNPKHLWLGDSQSNMTDMKIKKRGMIGDKNPRRTHPEKTVRGERQWKSILTAEKVLEIRALYQQKEMISVLAKKYGASESCIRYVCFEQSWRHLL